MSRPQAIQVVPTASDEAFCTWLAARFFGDEYAQRIQVVQVGAGNRHGEVVHTYDARTPVSDKAMDKPRLSRERIVEHANLMLAAAQRDVDALGRPTTYGVLAYHHAMGAEAYSRHLLRLRPKNVFADGLADAEEGTRLEKLLLGLLSEERRDKRWQMELAMNAISGAMERDAQRIATMEAMLDGRLDKETRFIEATEQALSRADERKAKNNWEHLKLAGARDALAMLRGFLPSVAAAVSNGKVGVDQAVSAFMESLTRAQLRALVGSESLQTPIGGILSSEQANLLRRIDDGEHGLVGTLFASLTAEQMEQVKKQLTHDQLATLDGITEGLAEASNANGTSETNGASAGQSAEQRALGKLLTDAQAAGIDIQLMGDWQADSGQLQCTTPGILSPDQVLLLLRVHRGTLPTSALDDLLPTSGTPLAVTPQQQEQVMAIVPAGIAATLGELIALRQRSTNGVP